MNAIIADPIHTSAIGVFDRTDQADGAFDELRRMGFEDRQIRLIVPDSGNDGTGLPERDSHWYETELKAGRTILAVCDADERADDAREVFRKHHGVPRDPTPVGTYGAGLPATPF